MNALLVPKSFFYLLLSKCSISICDTGGLLEVEMVSQPPFLGPAFTPLFAFIPAAGATQQGCCPASTPRKGQCRHLVGLTNCGSSAVIDESLLCHFHNGLRNQRSAPDPADGLAVERPRRNRLFNREAKLQASLLKHISMLLGDKLILLSLEDKYSR